MDNSKLDTSKIYVGETFDNLESLCATLGTEVKGKGARRVALMKKIKKYLAYEYDQKTRKYTITSVYDIPLDFSNGNSKYISLMEYLFLTKVMSSKSTTFTASTDSILMWLYMVNVNYGIESYRFNSIKRDEGIESVMFEDPSPEDNRVSFSSSAKDVFFSAVRQELSIILSKMLSSIKDRHALTYRKETVIVTKTERNPITGRICATEKHVATLQEERILNDVCAGVLRDMGMKKESDVYRYMRQYQYSAMVNMRLKNLYGWESTYKQLRIAFTPSTVQYARSRIYREFPQDIEECNKLEYAGVELNRRIVDRLKSMKINSTRFPTNMEFSQKNIDLINSYVDKYISVKSKNDMESIDRYLLGYIEFDDGKLFRDNYNDIDELLPYYECENENGTDEE